MKILELKRAIFMEKTLDTFIDILDTGNESMNEPEDRLTEIIQAKIHR